MVATQIPPHVVHTVFQYILPPSLPVPPHLLSKRVIERHHFLSVSPTDPASYLCWPSSDNAEVVEALERGGFQDALTSEPEHDVRYTAPDEETLLAHVRPDAHSPLQIVFAWDTGSETWKYHDARMLPFPNASLPSLDATLARQKAASDPEWPSFFNNQPLHARSRSPGSDNYWAGFESSGSSPDTSTVIRGAVAEEDDRAEAAYWASYSTVQGSGDSTVPSPRAEKRRLAHVEEPPDARGPETTFDPLVAHLHLRLQQNGLLSPHFSHANGSPHPVSEKPTPMDQKRQQARSIPVENSEDVEDDEYGFPKEGNLKMVGPSGSGMMCEPAGACAMGDTRSDEEEDGVREAIRGIYRMWKTQSRSEDPADTFVEIVKTALSTKA